MKQISLLLVFIGVISITSFSQQFIEKEKQVEVLETTEVETRKTSIGLAGGIVQYFGEYTSDMGLDYGLLIRSHINNKFDITYNFHLGDMMYKDSADLSQKTSYFGANALFKLNIVETITKSEKPKLISPYVGAGLGVLVSQAPHYTISQYVDFYFPVAAGIDINVSDNFIVGLNATGRVLFSDQWDNNTTLGGNDILFNPSLSLKYVIGKKKTTKQEYVTKTIKYKEEVIEKESLGKYEEKEIESFVEISVKEIRDSVEVTNNVEAVISEEEIEGGKVMTNISTKEKEGEAEVVTIRNGNNTNTSENESTASNNTNSTTESSNTVKEDVKEEIKEEVKEETSVVVKETSKEVNSANQDYLFYTVQVGTFNDRDYELKHVKQDFEFFNKELGKYNYCSGFFNNYSEAKSHLSEIKSAGGNGFVVALYKDERLKVYNANKLVSSGQARVDAEAAKQVYLK